MKLKSILGTSLLALFGIVFMASPARAAGDGDLILGFEELSGTATATNVMVDLGSYSDPVSSPININAVLTAAFGANWNTSGEVVWSIAGSSSTGGQPSPPVTVNGNQTADNLLWVTAPAGYTPTPGSNSSQGLAGTPIFAMYNTFSGSGAGSSVTVNPNTNVGDYSHSENDNGGYTIAYNYFTGETPTEFEIVGPGSANLYQLIAGSGIHSAPAESELGTFTLDSAGDITYIAAIIPEPSTYVLLGFGALGLVIVSRRRLSRLGLIG